MNISIPCVDGYGASVDYYESLHHGLGFAGETLAATLPVHPPSPSQRGGSSRSSSAALVPSYAWPMTPRTPPAEHFENLYYANYSPYLADEPTFIPNPTAELHSASWCSDHQARSEPPHYDYVPPSPQVEQGYFDHGYSDHCRTYETNGTHCYDSNWIYALPSPQPERSDPTSSLASPNTPSAPFASMHPRSIVRADGPFSPRTPPPMHFSPYYRRRSAPDTASFDRKASSTTDVRVSTASHLPSVPTTPQIVLQPFVSNSRRRIPLPLRQPGDVDDDEVAEEAAIAAAATTATARAKSKKKARARARALSNGDRAPSRKARPSKPEPKPSCEVATAFPSVLLPASVDAAPFPSVLLSYDSTNLLSPPESPRFAPVSFPPSVNSAEQTVDVGPDSPAKTAPALKVVARRQGPVLKFQAVNFVSTAGVATKTDTKTKSSITLRA